MQTIKLGDYLRNMRNSCSLGNLIDAGVSLGVSNNTLAAYEREETLPDVDFLAVFADRTGADFNELLRLRLASGKNKEARALAEALVPIEPIKTPVELEEKLEELAEWLDDLVENAEIADEGDNQFAFIDDQPRKKFLNEIKRILIFGAELPKEETEEIREKTVWSPPAGTVDPGLMGEIVSQLEKTFLNSPAAALTYQRFLANNHDLVLQFLESLKSPRAAEDIAIAGLLDMVARAWMNYASGEAGVASYIYNHVSQIQDKEERARAIELQTAFFIDYRMFNFTTEGAQSK